MKRDDFGSLPPPPWAVAAKLPSFGGGAEPICSADLHPPLPPLSALLPTSSLNYRPLTFDLGGGGPGPLIFVLGEATAPKLSMARRHCPWDLPATGLQTYTGRHF